MRDNTCNIRKVKRYSENMCKKKSGWGARAARGGGGFPKLAALAIKPKLLSFAEGTKKDTSKGGAGEWW